MEPVMDAIVVPGGGSQRSEEPSSLPWFVLQRLDAAFDRFHAAESRGLGRPKVLLLSAGTTHRPNYVNRAGWPIGESTSGALYLLCRCRDAGSGLRPGDIIRETTSLDTIGSAYFLRTAHTDPAGWRRLHVITSDFHMARTHAIFDFVFNCRGPWEAGYTVTYEATDSAPRAAIDARAAKEADGLRGFRCVLRDVFGVADGGDGVANATRRAAVTLRSVHEWIFAEHRAYATHDGMVSQSEPLGPEALRTY